MICRTSENGIHFIKHEEGFCPTIKKDNKGPMIGHGHDLSPVEIASKMFVNGINEEQADALLRNDLATRFDPGVSRLIPVGVTPTQNQFDALASFCYNLGVKNLATMLHHGWSQVALQMPAWHWMEKDGVEVESDDLKARRAREVLLFNS